HRGAELTVAFTAAERRVRDDDSVRAVVFAGNDQGYFSNGFEPSLFLGKDFDYNHNVCRLVNETALYFFFFPKPIIACLNGHAMGAGAVFSLFSDWRFMAEKSARFGFPEALLGMNFPSFVGRYMQDLVGLTATRDILFGGKSLKGPDALAIRLVDQVFPEDKVVEETLKFAEKLAKSPLQVLTGMKRARTEPYRALFESLRDEDARMLATYMTSPTVQEGLLSIVEKRRPRFD
ncbi:MAG TPA: enoyl-CoA hydratase/isomerase family protein, partial [Turneriella sp.]|nr:enoyl-CoA hydratase/isomerase family protein [Turneriella sp.]